MGSEPDAGPGRCAPASRSAPVEPTRSEPSAPPEQLPPVLTADEVAKILRLDRKTVYAALARGEIPGARRIGRAVRLHRDTVLDWLAQGQGRVSRSRRRR
jgi:excisionase family DNA binding protein